MSGWLSSRVFWCSVFSVVLHLATILGLSAGFSGIKGSEQGREVASIQLKLVKNPSFVPQSSSGQDEQVQSPSHSTSKQASGYSLKDGLPLRSVELEPELISQIDWLVDDVRIAGRLFLELVVEVDGSVTDIKVTYSELPESVTTDLLGRVASARFRPAMRGGAFYRKTVLLMLEVA